MPAPRSLADKLVLVALCFVLFFGAFLRLPAHLFAPAAPLHALEVVHPQAAFKGVGFDEGLYRRYVNGVIQVGLGNYPAVVDNYIEVQKTLTGSILPPMRFLFIGTAYFWHCLFGTEALRALHNVASFFSILTLLLATTLAWRLKGPLWALAVAALMSCAPTQIHMSQHALVDGFFSFWALLVVWLLWENLRAPRKPWLLVLYTISLSLLVLTKENSFFVFVALLALIVTNRWFGFGSVTKELLV